MKKSIFLFFAAILCAIGMNAATPEKLYLTPNSNWTQGNARFAAYFFGNGEKWVSMTKVTGETNLYEVTTPAGYPSVIFCRMNPNAAANNWNNKYNQTGDLTIPTDGKNHFTVPNGSWNGATTTWSIWPIPAEKTYKDITFTITASSAPKIHYWDGGDKMVGSDWNNLPTMSETAAGSGVYTYTVKDVDEFTGVKYLFKIGDLQTADQTTSADVTANLKDFFPKVAVMGVNNWDGTDVMTVADDYLSASITLPLTAKKYDLKLTVDGEWKGHKDQNHITRAKNSSVFKDNDGNGSITADYAGDYVFTYTYANQTLTVTYPELPAVKTYKDIVITIVANVTPKIHYWDGGDKVVATDWETKPDMVATGAANTYSYTIKDVDEALGVKYIIVAGTAQTEDLHTTVDVTANFKDLLPAVEVMGIIGWNAGEGIPMTIAEDYSASATINFTEAKTQEFKLTVGGAWKGHSENNKITRANNSSVFTDDSGNASVKVDVVGDYVFTYTYSDKKLTVTYPASDEPIVPHYYITGSFNSNNEADPNHEMTLDGTVYKATVTLAAGDNTLKVTDGTWDKTWGYGELGAAYEEVSDAGEYNNIKITLAAEKTITVIFDATAGKITFEGLTEKEVVKYDYYIAGTLPGAAWNPTSLGMTKEGDVYKHTFSELPAGIYEFKITDGTWEHQWNYYNLGAAYKEVSEGTGGDGKPNGNIKFGIEEAKHITVIFDATAGKITLGGLTEKVVTYQLKGVGGWDQPGIELVQNPNPEKASEYMLTCQAISATDAIKVVRLEDGEIKDYYGNGTVKDAVQVTVNYDTDGNIKLPAGTYNFYFDTAEPEKKLWIEAATDCGPATITLTTGNNDDVIDANIGNNVNVVIKRSFTANAGYYTLCVPFNMPASVIGKAYSLGTITEHVGGEGININLEEKYELTAGMPYLVLPKANMSELVVENVTIAEDDIAGQGVSNEEGTVNIFFEGFYSASGQTNGTTQYYVGNNGYLYNGEVNILGLCGLFTITDENGDPLKVRARVVTREEVETGLDNNQLPNTNIQKVLENGQLIIIRDGVKYNIQGQVIK